MIPRTAPHKANLHVHKLLQTKKEVENEYVNEPGPIYTSPFLTRLRFFQCFRFNCVLINYFIDDHPHVTLHRACIMWDDAMDAYRGRTGVFTERMRATLLWRPTVSDIRFQVFLHPRAQWSNIVDPWKRLIRATEGQWCTGTSVTSHTLCMESYGFFPILQVRISYHIGSCYLFISASIYLSYFWSLLAAPHGFVVVPIWESLDSCLRCCSIYSIYAAYTAATGQKQSSMFYFFSTFVCIGMALLLLRWKCRVWESAGPLHAPTCAPLCNLSFYSLFIYTHRIVLLWAFISRRKRTRMYCTCACLIEMTCTHTHVIIYVCVRCTHVHTYMYTKMLSYWYVLSAW